MAGLVLDSSTFLSLLAERWDHTPEFYLGYGACERCGCEYRFEFCSDRAVHDTSCCCQIVSRSTRRVVTLNDVAATLSELPEPTQNALACHLQRPKVPHS